METYTLVSQPNAGMVSVRRVSDGMMTRCKFSWLVSADDGKTYQARSKTKAIRLDGLEWTTEG